MIDLSWEEHHTLPDGTEVLLRLLCPTDADALRVGFQRLSPESRYRRFLSVLPALSDEMVRYLTETDGECHVAIVAGIVSPDLKSEEGIAVARYIRLPDEPDVAEAAVTVIDDFQGKGLGKLLLTTLVRLASGEGIRMFRAEVLPSNTAVQKLLASVGAIERERTQESVTYDIPIPQGEGSHEHRWQALFDLLKHAAASLTLVFRHEWSSRQGSEQAPP
ncbi:MAG: GNAT family N-acetyltransferase [Myxococcales bacterium]|nr:GNAT family N-acetyltransferase [Polyangiaceae bacterium]MDW8248118.1 GNAT family N-acetyltransferase [Myxococcales bacterium]